MPPRLSKVFSRSEKTDKQKEAEAEAERNPSVNPSPPPSYAPPGYDEGNILDPPDITAGFSNLSLDQKNQDDFPSSEEVIAHLKLLECFYRLRQQIGSTDGLFGINNSVVTSHESEGALAAELLAKVAERRWAVYLARAVDRFDAWLHALLPDAKMARVSQIQSDGEKGLLCEPGPANLPLLFGTHNLPPVDVLLVWHAYMLNPRAYLEDCLRLGRMSLWHTNMPWKSVADCINSETFAYRPDNEAESLFTASTMLPYDNLADARDNAMDCPSCKTTIMVPWTTVSAYGTKEKYTTSMLPAAIDAVLSQGSGYCDPGFYADCPTCPKTVWTHQRLKAAKFCGDVQLLLERGLPLGGTLFGLDGLPGKVAGHKDGSWKSMNLLPNDLLYEGLGKTIVDSQYLNRGGLNQNMTSIRGVIEEALRDRSYMRRVRQSLSTRLDRAQKIAIRRMMSRYWENSSPFALDLVGAVIRQGSFIEKMHNIDWLHSPALPSTMGRLLTKYQRFVGIMADRLHMAVPTLDVDLAWHTHQLSPYGYLNYTVINTKQFIDHDDKVAETALNDAFAWTSKTYQRLFDEPYSECTCWYCEATRESHTSAASRLFNGSQARTANALVHKVEQDPSKSVHISAHNAVRPSDDHKYTERANKQAGELEKAYGKACARARKSGRREPKREDYYYSDAWGYPVYIPAYSPYGGYMPYSPMYYPVTPGCMAVGAGAVGNCCSGTCGGGVAAGSCGGGGAGGCAGGAAGGCGGGGGGGGGCGGGGGGCGGGGGGGCGGGGGG
ncbi:hypothetical protein LTR12_005175 [Friedmanniomyces endolithicus]|nr:hypothetical protein LTR12_005175 [Friedmanniomyces endolithicus]